MTTEPNDTPNGALSAAIDATIARSSDRVKAACGTIEPNGAAIDVLARMRDIEERLVREKLFGVATAQRQCRTAVAVLITERDAQQAVLAEYIAARDEYEAAKAPPNSHAPAPRISHADPRVLRYREARAALARCKDSAPGNRDPQAPDESPAGEYIGPDGQTYTFNYGAVCARDAREYAAAIARADLAASLPPAYIVDPRNGSAVPVESPEQFAALRDALWECFRLAGGDTDGRVGPAGWNDASLITSATDVVRDLRECYDGAIAPAAPPPASAPDVLRIPRSATLDPIFVYFEDFEPGQGRITIACYGDAWTAAWGAMGDRTVRRFVAECDSYYLTGSLLQLCGANKRRRDYTARVATAVIVALNSIAQEPKA